LAKWDLIGIGLVMCFVTLPPTGRFILSRGDHDLRPTKLKQYAAENPSSLTTVGVKIYLLCSVIDGNVDYGQIEELITSFSIERSD
jgi:hypothetical protein